LVKTKGAIANPNVRARNWKTCPTQSEGISWKPQKKGSGNKHLLNRAMSTVRGSVCSVAEGNNRTGSNFFPGFRILFPSLLGPQEKGGNETSYRPTHGSEVLFSHWVENWLNLPPTVMEGRGSSLPFWAVDNVRGGNDLGPRARFLNTLRTRLLSMRCFRNSFQEEWDSWQIFC
jgi:hypothetical protein